MKFRIEKDYLGQVKVPADAYWGAQTQRAIENFPISGIKFQHSFIKIYAIIKLAAAIANMSTGKLNKKVGGAIVKACGEIISGKLQDQFQVDVYQAGAGTSTNMNLNEVIANRAVEILGGKKGNYNLVHPNDHVNMSQSTNDTFHSAIHFSALDAIKNDLLPAMKILEKELGRKSKQFGKIIKSGRTHLMDAVPLTLGQEFSAYATAVEKAVERIERTSESLREIPLGGTAIGTGLNAGASYTKKVIKELNKITRLGFKSPKNFFAAMQFTNVEAEVSSVLKILAIALIKISNDIRLLASGPTTGLGEIHLPAVQPGSSIMPGKVNPSVLEMVDMVGFQVIGNDAVITYASQAGQLELNVMMPVIAYNLLNSIEILANGCRIFANKCVNGIRPNERKIKEYLEKNPAVVTALAPEIGYEKAAEVAKRAYKEDKSIKQVLHEMKLWSKGVERIFDFKKLV